MYSMALEEPLTLLLPLDFMEIWVIRNCRAAEMIGMSIRPMTGQPPEGNWLNRSLGTADRSMFRKV